MVVKLGIFGTAVAATGLYFGGAFDVYPRVVDGSPSAVMASLADLDVREMPGEPGSTAEAAGGIKPRFQLGRAPNRLEWTVYSGTEVATRMIATFEPVDGGRRTRIVAAVERGEAPDSRISPAFRSDGVTLGLFHMALDSEIAEMTAPGWGEHCDALQDRLLPPGMPGTGNALDAIARLHKAQAELLAAGCNIDRAPGAGFRETEALMNNPEAAADAAQWEDQDPEIDTAAPEPE